MRRIYVLLIGLLLTLGVNAQYKMVVTTTDGMSSSFKVKSIEKVSWVLDEDEEPGNDEGETTVTGDATDITTYTASITSWANILDNLSTDLRVGIIFCATGTPTKNNGTIKEIRTSDLGADACYTVKLTGLAPSTTYYYRSFVYQSGIWFYGKTNSFTTKSQGVNLVSGETSQVTCFSAKASGAVSVDATTQYSSLQYGICYGTNTEPTVNNTRILASTKDADGNFTCQLNALAGSTTYYYRSYAYVDSYLSYGPIRSFTTKDDNVVITGDIDSITCKTTSTLTLGSGAYSKVKLGVCYGTNETPTINDMIVAANEVDEENQYTLVLKNVEYEVLYYYRSYVEIDEVAHYGEVKSFTKKYVTNVGEYVDLGLSVKWATFNVGATSPGERGDYFAWGETIPKSDYSWSTYRHCYKGSYNNITKYCITNSYGNNGFADNKIVLDPEDDAASANWGGNWRMPTIEEWKELYDSDNCTWTGAVIDNVYGFKVQSKKEGYTDNWIFLPVAGCRGNTNFTDVSSKGLYWSSSLDTSDSRYASYFNFYYGYRGTSEYGRCGGQSVRPVCQ